MFSHDRALVRRLLAGDEAAFEVFFDEQAPRLYRFALSRLGNRPDTAEEIVQATLLKVITKLKTYRGEAALFSWLCTFCLREISAFYRKARRAPVQVELMEDSVEIRTALELLAASSDGDPERRLVREELTRLVQVTLDYLPHRYADALEWKYIEGISVNEIAGRLGIGSIAAQSLLARARAAFRRGFKTVTARLDMGELATQQG